ncbi:MAG TPA: hypothetical protein VGJ92_03090 [Methanocella sp.]|jgi:hypothetical protein
MRWNLLLTGTALLLLIAPAVAAAASTWGYDLPYSYAYGAGVPFYVGHNNGEPSGDIYENPALYPNGISAPSVIYGQPENAMDLNFSHAYPSIAGLTYGSGFSPFTFHDIT